MIRPPPLQLKYDNRFPMPAKTPSKAKSPSFASQLYKANWKNAIIAVAGLNGLRYAFAVYNAISDAAIDDEEVFDNLFRVSIALAVIYLFAFFIEVYGIFSVSLQRLSLIRGYLYLTFLCSVLVTSAGVLQGVSYFLFAEDIVMECASLAMQGRGYAKSLFRSRPWPSNMLPIRKLEARKHCAYAWVHQSWSQVASVFLFFLIPSVIYYLFVYTYYRQTIDPGHPANLQHTHSPTTGARTSRRPGMSQQRRGPPLVVGAEAGLYANVGYSRLNNNTSLSDDDSISRPMDQGLTTSRLQPAPACSPRPRRGANGGVARMNGNGNRNGTGPNNPNSTNSFATKGIKRARRPPPLISSPSPLGLNNTPGAPAYGPSRVYAAFAAPVGSAGYDKFV